MKTNLKQYLNQLQAVSKTKWNVIWPEWNISKYSQTLYADWNKYVLRRFLNTLIETQLRMSMGREFHNLGAHEEKALSPYEENVFGFLVFWEVYLKS